LADGTATGGEGRVPREGIVSPGRVYRHQPQGDEPGVRFYNRQGTAEQCIREGKRAVKMTRLSCHQFLANDVQLWRSIIGYLGNLWRQLTLPKLIGTWSLTSLQQRR
jgi:hypothetical protein